MAKKIGNGWDKFKNGGGAVVLGGARKDPSDSFTVRVKVRRGLNPRQILAAANLVLSTDNGVIGTMPLMAGQGEEDVVFVFFKADRSLPYAGVDRERKRRGLVRDLAAQIQASAIVGQMMATYRTNGDCWQDKKGRWCVVLLYPDFFSNGEKVCAHCRRVDGASKGRVKWDRRVLFGGRLVQ